MSAGSAPFRGGGHDGRGDGGEGRGRLTRAVHPARCRGLRLRHQLRPPRVDRTFQRGRAVELGEFVVETFPLVGHTPDGSGFRLRELGLLVVGDYLSSIEFPFATSPSAYRLTLAGLIELLHEDPPAAVIPGHGPPLTAEEALAVAEADLGYLRSLHVAVVDALAGDGTRDEAQAAGLAVALPRESAPDLDEMRGFNVERELEEILPAAT